MASARHSSTHSRHHIAKIHGMLGDLVAHLREDVRKVNDPGAQALFETSAEVLSGLARAYKHYDAKSEEAWRD